jgi:tetratricopeptide (TPR) repeat protein
LETSTGFGGDRETDSVAWFYEGDKYMRYGDLDYAMRRYIQAWLLNPDSYGPYWGFARVAEARQKFDEAFKYFEKAMQLINDKYQKPALVCDIGIAYHNRANAIKDDPQEQARYFDLANQKFRESTAIDPSYPESWEAWAFSLYHQGKYGEAWEKIKKAQALGPNIVSEDFLKKLRDKMTEPK